jgi:hypothetical protein
MRMGSRLSPRRWLNTTRRAPTGAVRRWATSRGAPTGAVRRWSTSRGAPTGAVRDMGNNPASAYGSPPVDAVHPVGAYGSGPAVGGQHRGGSRKRSPGWVASRGRLTGAVRGLRVTWARLPEAIRGLLVVLWGLRRRYARGAPARDGRAMLKNRPRCQRLRHCRSRRRSSMTWNSSQVEAGSCRGSSRGRPSCRCVARSAARV